MKEEKGRHKVDCGYKSITLVKKERLDLSNLAILF